MHTDNKKITKNILFIAHMDIYPCKHGGHIGVFFPLKYFAQKCNVFFAFPTQDKTSYSKEKFEKFNIKALPFILNTDDNYLKYPLSVFSKLSFKFSKFYRKNIMKQLCEVINKNNIDTVWCFAAQTSNYGLELKKRFPHLKIILREHNIEYKLVKQYSKGSNNIFMKIFSYYEYLKTKIYEVNIWKLFNKVYFISDTDLAVAKKYNNNFNDSNLIYDGMDVCEDYSHIVEEEKSFIFCGALSSYQNKRNLKNFINTIWTPFIQKVPDAKLYITGNDEDFLCKQLMIQKEDLNSLNIINLGFVNNIKETIASKKYLISPTLYGSGIRIKVLEGLSLSKVIFVTDIDYNMVHYFKDMENIVYYTNFDVFYSKYVLLENNQVLFKSIKSEGNKLMQYFSWEKYVNNAMDFITKMENSTL